MSELEETRKNTLAYLKEMFEDKKRKYTCHVCGKDDVSYETKDKFDYFINNEGNPQYGASLSKKFIVCSEECRSNFVLNGNVPYSYLMNDVDIPAKYQRFDLDKWNTDDSLDKEILTKARNWLGGKCKQCGELVIFHSDNSHKAQPNNVVNNSLTLLGKTGTGKTALASALALELRKRGLSVIWLDSYEWVIKLNAAVRKGDEYVESFLKYHAKYNAVILDDLSKHKLNEDAHILFNSIFMKWYMSNTIVVVTTNFSLDEISKNLDERVYSRLAENIGIVFKNKDRRVG